MESDEEASASASPRAQFFYRTRRDAVGSPRIVRSSRRAAGLPARRYPGMLVNKGAHVYLRKSDAVRRAAYDGGTVVVPVRVRLKHFVAAEGWTRRLFGDGYFHHGQAVFTQYRILKKDWDAIFNQ